MSSLDQTSPPITPDGTPLVAVDIGNSRLKFGLFERPAGHSPNVCRQLPQPTRAVDVPPDAAQFDRLIDWLAPATPADCEWLVGSVNREAAALLASWLERRQAAMWQLSYSDLPLTVRLPRPDLVGIDRLLDAVAANCLRTPQVPAIVVDVGTAITVDLLDGEGAFLGGAILPGSGTTARALFEYTDLLPQIDAPSLAEPPPPVGDSTIAAMRSGLFWGAVGGIRQLVELFQRHASREAEVYLTGGAAPVVAECIGPSAVYVPHLTLSGIAVASLRS